MAEGKSGVLVYSDWIKKFEALSDDEAGRLIKHFFRYINDQSPIAPDRITEISFIDIENTLKRDLIKWEDSIEIKSLSGRMGNLKRWNLDLYELIGSKSMSIEEAEKIAEDRKASRCDEKLTGATKSVANIAVSVSDSVTVSVSDIKDIKGDVPKKEHLTIEQRKLNFGKSLEKYKEKYNRPMLVEFFKHWTEHKEGGKKMLFEMKPTFSISGRLAKWKSNDYTALKKNNQLAVQPLKSKPFQD